MLQESSPITSSSISISTTYLKRRVVLRRFLKACRAAITAFLMYWKGWEVDTWNLHVTHPKYDSWILRYSLNYSDKWVVFNDPNGLYQAGWRISTPQGTYQDLYTTLSEAEKASKSKK